MSIRFIFVLIIFLFVFQVFAQIKTEHIEVQKVYEPDVQHLEKINQQPKEIRPEQPKFSTTFTPLNLPVASQFKATQLQMEAPLKKPQKVEGINNYFSASYGSYKTPEFEFFLSHQPDSIQLFGLSGRFLSTKAGTKTPVQAERMQWELSPYYQINTSSSRVRLRVSIAQDRPNYYGVSPDLDPEFYKDQRFLNNYYKVAAQFDYSSYKERGLDSVQLRSRRFSNKFDVVDYDLYAKALYRYFWPANKSHQKIGFQFGPELYYNRTAGLLYINKKTYSGLMGSAKTLFVWSQAGFELKAGFRWTYNGYASQKDSKFYLHPMFYASVDLSDAFMPFIGFEGGIKNPSYHDLYLKNPYISPRQEVIWPTNTQYNTYLGTKGKLGSMFSYQALVGYKKVDNQPLFLVQPFLNTPNRAVYDYGNSFTTVYTPMKQWTLSLEGLYEPFELLSFRGKAAYYHYKTEKTPQAWGLANYRFDTQVGYRFLNRRLELSADAFVQGPTKTLLFKALNKNKDASTKTLDSYMDLGFSMRYSIDRSWQLFLRLNNLLNKHYESWTNYKAQGIQLMLGAQLNF